LVVDPFTSVTTIAMVLLPWFNESEPEVVPELIALDNPAEFILVLYVAFDLTAVGVTVIDETLVATVAEYEVVFDANEGESVPEEMAKAERFASATVRVNFADATWP
jgi:hypothetical protein